MFAIIKVGSSQYTVLPGQEILVDYLGKDKGEITIDHVLLFENDNKIILGKPFLSDIKVTAKIIGTTKGDKIRVSKFKAKSRYKKTIGFRPTYSKLQIIKINNPSKAS